MRTTAVSPDRIGKSLCSCRLPLDVPDKPKRLLATPFPTLSGVTGLEACHSCATAACHSWRRPCRTLQHQEPEDAGHVNKPVPGGRVLEETALPQSGGRPARAGGVHSGFTGAKPPVQTEAGGGWVTRARSLHPRVRTRLQQQPMCVF